MYRIMLRKKERADFGSLYSFMTAEKDGVTSLIEIGTKEELDAKVEEMLNGGYAKADFIVVKVIDYTIDAKEYSDDE